MFLIALFASGNVGAIMIVYLTVRKIAHARAVQRQYAPWKQSCQELRREELAAMCETVAMNMLT